ncbi:hypothetical protein PSTT_04412 [Puccinia striiformis]|uniref:Extracellular membrane protein CFEM domain-containing protein n=1 Tax=Puccinia striiformis TaxID=27350 RepID=A0A2S4VTA9_9BASI|nr:hypothetical protein PSTT_04412 [Puccinia striiformis]
MMVISPVFVYLLVAIQATSAQDATGTDTSASTPATPPAGGTSLFGAIGGLVSATVQTASSGASTAATTVSTALSGAGSAVANVTVTAVDHLNCASSAQNINTCVAQGTKDVSNCAQTNDACLCQTYGNLARCYSSCKSLSAQVDQYQSQSADHCMKAGLKPNSTASVSSPTSNATASSNSPGNATTTKGGDIIYISARSAACGSVQLSSLALVSILLSALAVLLA